MKLYVVFVLSGISLLTSSLVDMIIDMIKDKPFHLPRTFWRGLVLLAIFYILGFCDI